MVKINYGVSLEVVHRTCNQNENADERENTSECVHETMEDRAIKDQQDKKQTNDGFMF